VDEQALVEALTSGQVGGRGPGRLRKRTAWGFTANEVGQLYLHAPPGRLHPEAQENVALGVAEQIIDYLLNGVIRNAVNVPSVSAQLLERVRPYLTLAERLGAFQAQIIQAG